jgi:toxin ParE1/3/4
MKTLFHTLARREMNEAADYYEAAMNGLGKQFLDEISYAVQFIRKHPKACPQVDERIRRMVLDRFPYSLFYSVLPDKIWILAVAHQKRRPSYWVNRT